MPKRKYLKYLHVQKFLDHQFPVYRAQITAERSILVIAASYKQKLPVLGR